MDGRRAQRARLTELLRRVVDRLLSLDRRRDPRGLTFLDPERIYAAVAESLRLALARRRLGPAIG